VHPTTQRESERSIAWSTQWTPRVDGAKHERRDQINNLEGRFASDTVKNEVIAIFTAAFGIALQVDGSTAPVGSTMAQAPGALMDMLHNIGSIALFVLAVLLFASLYSWTVILGKISTFGKATNESRKFVRAFRKASRLQEISALAETFKSSPLAQVFIDVYETYRRQTGGAGPPRNITALERSAQTAASESITGLERRMTWLATIAATSPFVGLFGTVMGVVDAFHGLGTAGAATLRAVAPGISEALITTAAGLFVAVPAVVAYNQFTARIRVLASATDDFCRELLNSLEEIPDRSASASPRGAGLEAAEEIQRGFYK
jgi:biopolymer transport protein TolQ